MKSVLLVSFLVVHLASCCSGGKKSTGFGDRGTKKEDFNAIDSESPDGIKKVVERTNDIPDISTKHKDVLDNREYHIDIKLRQVSPFRITCSETGSPPRKTNTLKGDLEVVIKNLSNHKIAVAHMDPANFRFRKRGNKDYFSLFHVCAPGFLFYGWDKNAAKINDNDNAVYSGDWGSPQGGYVVFIEPGKTKYFENEGWECDGGPYEPHVEAGEYEIIYRLHEIEPTRSFPDTNPSLKSLEETISSIKHDLNRVEFWENSFFSNTITVKIEEEQCETLL